MSWQAWVRNTAGRLDIPTAEYTGVTVEVALNHLSELETSIVDLRVQLLSAAESRALHADEITSFDMARHNVWSCSVHIIEALKELGAPPGEMPQIHRLAGLPKAVMQQQVQNQALGAINLNSSRAYRPRQVMGALGGGPLPVVIAVGASLVAVLAGSALLVSILTDFVHPEIAMEQSITERVVALAQSHHQYQDNIAAALAAGQDPASILPPPEIDEALVTPQGSIRAFLWKATVAAGVGTAAYLLVKRWK